MTSKSRAAATSEYRTARPNLSRIFQRFLPKLQVGRLTVIFPSGDRINLDGKQPGLDASVEIKRWRALWRLVVGGDIQFAESYADGDWSTPDLTGLLHLAMLNEQAFSRLMAGSWFTRVLRRLHHFRRRNTRHGSRENISAHYDLGNSFYATWLDRNMNYSSGIYNDSSMSLEQAQDAKLRRIVELLDVKGMEDVLEIGCGWGSLAERLIRNHACRVTGITLSTEQLAFASEKLSNAIASETADFRLQDYRDVDGRFDRVVSIEMMEAVGEKYWPDYFATLRNRLREGGTAVLQVITIAEERFAAYRGRPDFIQRYIFPGGMLPTPALISEHARCAGLSLVDQDSFGESYARTLMEWRKRFGRARTALKSAGFDEGFCRLWDYYLAYCEVGFRMKLTDVALYKFRRV